MSTKPAPMRRELAFTTVLLAPFWAIERTRGWRRLGLLVLYLLIMLLIWALLWRRAQLRGLPDVGAPFDEAAPGTTVRVPDDRNAFVPYRRAAERFRDMNEAESNSFTGSNLLWSRADATLRHWVADHEEAIALLRAGSERPGAYLEVQNLAPGENAIDAKIEILRRLSWIGDAALYEAGRVRAEGDVAGAWTLLKAVVRASRHMTLAVPAIEARSHSVIMVQFAHWPVSEWAEDPAVGVALLRRALDDLVAVEALTVPLAPVYREKYRSAEESLANLLPLMAWRAEHCPAAGRFDLFAQAPSLEAFFHNEPERSRRVLRLLAANDLAWCNRPAFERPALAVPRLQLYEADPATSPAARALSPEELARWADSALVTPALNWRLGNESIEHWDKTDRWSLGRLKEAVALALFTREMGRPPATPAEALERYFPLPGDSPSRDEAEPVREQGGKESPGGLGR